MIQISEEAYQGYVNDRKELAQIRADRASEREQWEWVYERRGSNCYFIIRTLDRHLCYVPPGTNGLTASRRRDGKLELICMEDEKPDINVEMLPTRRLRRYVETDEQIRGVPVLQEEYR